MSKRIQKISRSQNSTYHDHHRFEHWLVDNQIYFITSRVRNRIRAFASEAAKTVFWDRFDQYTAQFGFTPWITSLLDNHYHTLGHLCCGENLPKLMQRLHGSVSKLVNDLNEPTCERITPFWRTSAGKEYFDGCIRDQIQARCTYRYILLQSVRHGMTRDWRQYAHTRINGECEMLIAGAKETEAFLEGVPYKRYQKRD